ncbi:MAG TPA: oligosaccharide flippase family protein [Luteitalea sp.]|nr:oligosaccharide flippase family protein [Luteitalea sp.]
MSVSAQTRSHERLRTSAAWNIAATCWSAALNLACLPLFLGWLGAEAFGLLVFYAALQSITSLFDLGISRVIARELAAQRDVQRITADAVDLARTLESAYWVVGTLIGLLVVGAAPLFAHRWLTLDRLNATDVTTCLRLMGVVFALQWPFSFYSGAFQGLERQAAFNRVYMACTTLRYVGALGVLRAWPDPVAFFAWQGIAAGVQTVLLNRFLWRFLGGLSGTRLRPVLLSEVWRFGLGLSGVSVLSVLLSQADKLILSRMLPLSAMGYYGLANSIAQALSIATNAISTAAFPRLARLATDDSKEALAALYGRVSQMSSVVVSVPAALLVIFPYELAFAWTRDSRVAHQVAPLLGLLALGTWALALQAAPYTLALAHRWTRPMLVIGVLALPGFVWGMVTLVGMHGVRGAAETWLLLNVTTMPFLVSWVHGRLLPTHGWQWWVDVGRPCAAAVAMTAAARPIVRLLPHGDAQVAAIGVTAIVSGLSAVAISPSVRELVLARRA